jgi:hypothetical protein
VCCKQKKTSCTIQSIAHALQLHCIIGIIIFEGIRLLCGSLLFYIQEIYESRARIKLSAYQMAVIITGFVGGAHASRGASRGTGISPIYR